MMRAEHGRNGSLRVTGQDDPLRALLNGPVSVVNIGFEGFAAVLRQQEVPVVQVDWAPPAGGDPRLIDLLEKLGA